MAIDSSERAKLIEDLITDFKHNCDPKTKQWFDRYLKGAIGYRGLKTPQVTKLVVAWHQRHQLDLYEPQEQLDLCADLIASSLAEDKFAGTIYLQKFLLRQLDYKVLLARCHRLFERGYFFDWSTTDWFCTRILDSTVLRHGLDAANIVAEYRHSANLWQRRAAIVSFRHASSDRQYHPLITKIIADLLPTSERFIQTGIGWVLADLSKSYPAEAEKLFRQHLDLLSQEVCDRHTKHLACHHELKQLKRIRAKTI